MSRQTRFWQRKKEEGCIRFTLLVDVENSEWLRRKVKEGWQLRSVVLRALDAAREREENKNS